MKNPTPFSRLLAPSLLIIGSLSCVVPTLAQPNNSDLTAQPSPTPTEEPSSNVSEKPLPMPTEAAPEMPPLTAAPEPTPATPEPLAASEPTQRESSANVIMSLYPGANSFYNGKVGRVLISATKGGGFYTSYQTKSGKVKIVARLEPAKDAVGKTVYFRLRTPDPDDRSPYEGNIAGDDNRPNPAGATGMLSAPSAKAVLQTINGHQYAVASVELTISQRYAGNNYAVQASLNSNFTAPLYQTTTLTAWKRVYLEVDRMYQSGATVVTTHNPDADSNRDVLHVDNTADLKVGRQIVLFGKTGVTRTRTLRAKTAATITVDDLNVKFERFSGVRPVGANSVVSSQLTTYLLQAYGSNTDGSDGGAFVEFRVLQSGSSTIPKFKTFPISKDDVTAFDFCAYWFANRGNGNSEGKNNVFQLVAAIKHQDGSFGTASQERNVSFITTGNFAIPDIGNIPNAIAETVVHELGHQFNLFPSTVAHVHAGAGVNAPNINNGSDQCVMTYSRVRDNGIAEFDAECLYHIRDESDPR